jgi:hypothetical protein
MGVLGAGSANPDQKSISVADRDSMKGFQSSARFPKVVGVGDGEQQLGVGRSVNGCSLCCAGAPRVGGLLWPPKTVLWFYLFICSFLKELCRCVASTMLDSYEKKAVGRDLIGDLRMSRGLCWSGLPAGPRKIHFIWLEIAQDGVYMRTPFSIVTHQMVAQSSCATPILNVLLLLPRHHRFGAKGARRRRRATLHGSLSSEIGK